MFYVIKIISIKEIRAFFQEIVQKCETELEGTFTKHEKLVLYTAHKKWSFPLRISSVNVTKSAVSCGFFIFCAVRHDIATLSTTKAEACLAMWKSYFSENRRWITLRKLCFHPKQHRPWVLEPKWKGEETGKKLLSTRVDVCVIQTTEPTQKE